MKIESMKVPLTIVAISLIVAVVILVAPEALRLLSGLNSVTILVGTVMLTGLALAGLVLIGTRLRAGLALMKFAPSIVLVGCGSAGKNMWLCTEEMFGSGVKWVERELARRMEAFVFDPVDNLPARIGHLASRLQPVSIWITKCFAPNGEKTLRDTREAYRHQPAHTRWSDKHKSLDANVTVLSWGFSGPSAAVECAPKTAHKSDLSVAFVYGDSEQPRRPSIQEAEELSIEIRDMAPTTCLVWNDSGRGRNEKHRLIQASFALAPMTPSDLESDVTGVFGLHDANKLGAMHTGVYAVSMPEVVERSKHHGKFSSRIRNGQIGKPMWNDQIKLLDPTRSGFAVAIGAADVLADLVATSSDILRNYPMYGRAINSADNVVLTYFVKLTEADIEGSPFGGFETRENYDQAPEDVVDDYEQEEHMTVTPLMAA